MADEVLIVDDDTRLSAMLRDYLEASGFAARAVASAAEGVAAVRGREPGAVVLDVMLPDFDGFEACRRIRAFSAVPIVMLTAKGEETDRIVGLEIGADDYLAKPFSPRELVARLRAVLRRSIRGQAPDTLRFGRLAIDPASRTLTVDGGERALTSYQFDLLVALARNAGRTLSREQLMDAVKGEELDALDRSIDVHVSRIRAMIEDDPKHPRRIVTVRGAGYVFARHQDRDG
jgi:two-component system, OmpR family, phosphate regulon response regulator OmpR